MQLEVNPNNRKQVKVQSKKNAESSIHKEEVFIDLENEIKSIKEAALTKPTDYELEKWYEFLKLNNLYEENV